MWATSLKRNFSKEEPPPSEQPCLFWPCDIQSTATPHHTSSHGSQNTEICWTYTFGLFIKSTNISLGTFLAPAAVSLLLTVLFLVMSRNTHKASTVSQNNERKLPKSLEMIRFMIYDLNLFVIKRIQIKLPRVSTWNDVIIQIVLLLKTRLEHVNGCSFLHVTWFKCVTLIFTRQRWKERCILSGSGRPQIGSSDQRSGLWHALCSDGRCGVITTESRRHAILHTERKLCCSTFIGIRCNVPFFFCGALEWCY